MREQSVDESMEEKKKLPAHSSFLSSRWNPFAVQKIVLCFSSLEVNKEAQLLLLPLPNLSLLFDSDSLNSFVSILRGKKQQSIF